MIAFIVYSFTGGIENIYKNKIFENLIQTGGGGARL